MNRRECLQAAAKGLIALSAIFAQAGVPPFGRAEGPAGDKNQPSLSASPFIHPELASKSKEDVGLRLVCVFDTGGSIDAVEYDAQLEAMARSIESDDFRNAVFYVGGPQSIAITVVDFGYGADIRVPWVDIRKGEEEKFKALAGQIRSITRNFRGGTHQAQALDLSGKCLENCPWGGKRNVVDVITDGKENSIGNGDGGDEVNNKLLDEAVTRLARDHDATVNALITLDPLFDDLDTWARKHLVTREAHLKEGDSLLRPGFVRIVATQQSTKNEGALVEYRKAMEMAFRRKIILEVAGIQLEDLSRIMLAGTRHEPAKPGP